ncbi:NAD(P)/FAD-dependent oxidoreductase [Kibdelosporangium aridum]|uniref:NAD(P)/FAD-dependent oxidoreductase n=1 Tax=Kibdelosporangium aridum TaxID=2030 RepID=A0A428ZH69_KIBAR|nr:NAD(P)/FAD-dependent oxidoreductase [Kibdelosporangium aridum]RSM87405.1 NAD(P)/FAD-dependent oxidoreductase [Kibdelosporangium aridum]
MTDSNGRTRVLVVGGGPAGSVAATALAQQGISVQLIESAQFPRYHIGESLTPSCRTILEQIGVAEKLDNHGFVIKHGGAFRWDTDSWIFDWGSQVGSRSWQVDRSEFDLLLLNHAQDNGVKVSMGVTAKAVQFTGDRPTSVRCATDSGSLYTIDDFDYLIDATGRYGLLSARHFKDRHPHQNLQNVAVWGYWTGAKMLPDTPTGGINIISTPEGWFWVIPLADGRTSIGFVTSKESFARHRQNQAPLNDIYLPLIAESPALSDLVEDAEYQGTAHVETDYSYVGGHFGGPGYMIVGDAACFLDPLLSSGVHLAVYSAFNAAASIASVDRGEVTEQEALDFFEFAYRRAYTRLLALVSVMYERYLGKDGLFHISDRLVGATSPNPDDAPSSLSFAEIIGGVSDMREATDAGTRVLTEQLADEAFKVQQRSVSGVDGVSKPDFSSVLENPLRDAKSTEYTLVTTPRLGLARVTEPSV